MTYDKIIWLDIETTGLDPARDKILEVAFVLTTPQGEELAACDWQIYQDGACDLVEDLWVLDTHTESGLWEECAHSIYSEDSADMAISSWLQGHGIRSALRHSRRLGGRNVGTFDLPFLAASRLGYSAGHLPFRCVDVTSVASAMEAAGVALPKQEGKCEHRALKDLRRDIEWYRMVLAILRGE